ncbi:MAG: 2,3-bisphosphoglycerate-independent phosphoglycerate mutase, partial [Clostridiales bacterium]|nr:2,3-bisphosphoglycerate-independent phosphoglycerate mutase [Clostridiales bacterium]
MKYIVILGDGMADRPVPELGDRTPLQAAKKPNMDFFAKHGELGLVKTVPDGISPGSDTANLSVLGFDPKRLYTGRSPIEAVSMGVSLGDDDVAYRCNLVSLSDAERYEDKVMVDYSSDEISSAEAAELICAVNERLLSADLARRLARAGAGARLRFHPGISYRHCMVWNGGGLETKCTPPHDILERRVGDHLPKNGGDVKSGAGDGADGGAMNDADILNLLMKDSYEYLSEHEVNRERVRRGLLPANSIWLWGQGKRLALPSFCGKYGLSGAVISAVDLIKGIGISAGLRSIEVEGATGVLHTNYEGKATAALDALKSGCDFVYIHIEAPDECGHRYEIENKVTSIEYIDARLIAPLL